MLRRCHPNLVRVICVSMSPDGGCMTEAMIKMGFTPYTLKTAFTNAATDAIEWDAIYSGKKRADHNFFSKYDCLIGPPSSIVFDKLLDAFPPYTKVILVEEPNKEQWAAEMEAHLPLAIAASETLKGHSRVAGQMTNMVKSMIVEPLSPQAGGYAGALEEFEHRVRNTVPRSRLLQWRYGEGYEPIGEFLNIPIPHDPFPSYDNGFDILQRMTERLEKARAVSRGLLVIVVFLSCIMLWPVIRRGGAVMDDLYRDYQVAFVSAESDGKDVNNARNAMILAKEVTVSFEEKWRNRGALGITTRSLGEGGGNGGGASSQ